MNSYKLKKFGLFGLGISLAAFTQTTRAADVNVTANITTDTTWSAADTYILTDIIYVKNNATLTIEAGTTIKGEPVTPGSFDPGALVITQGAKIMADGTADNPIIFTATADDGTLTEGDSGLWGGLIILGKATINRPAGTEYIEGLPQTADGIYGGTDDADNSGVLRYVSIRHGGATIAADNEINGLSLGGVGSGTTIEFVEVFANADDGYEFFGGTVNTKYLISAFNQDDSFDWDEGFRGKGQFWFALQDAVSADNGAEMDGGSSEDVEHEPYSMPVIYNATFIGAGSDAGTRILRFRENSGGIYGNSIFTEFTKGVEVVPGDKDKNPVTEDSVARFNEGSLALKGNIFHNIGTYTTLAEVNEINGTAYPTFEADFTTALGDEGNTYEDPQLAGISRMADAGLNPRPATDGPAYANLAGLPDGDDWYSSVTHKGAFGTSNWTSGWTRLDTGYNGDIFVPATGGEIQVTANITGNTTWTKANTYVLTDIIYVQNSSTLTIEPGTVIKSEPKSAGAFDPGALVVTQGSKIYAVGTPSEPIIFTSSDDDGTLTSADSGLWGGVILLGKAPINVPGGTEYIEGLPQSDNGLYGGNNPEDNSGTMKYVSIRHGGAAIASDNEINGLTLGGVGSGTTIEHVEVYANADDGYEFFGGTVNTKYLISAFNQDDSFDWDEGFQGKGQFWFAIQDPVSANRGAEMDGGSSGEVEAMPYSKPVIYNATFIGSGKDSGNVDSQALKFRENSGGIYANSIFTEFVKGVDIDKGDKDLNPVTEDSEARFDAGDLALKGNIFFNIGTATDLSGVNGVSSSDTTLKANFGQALTDNGNTYEDPQIGSISYDTDGGLDPRPADAGPAYSALSALPTGDSFYKSVTFKGAFGFNNWASGWSKLSASGAFGNAAATTNPAISGATSLGDDWYASDTLGTVYSSPETQWIYLFGFGWVYPETGTNWYYSADTGLGWLNIDAANVSTETIAGSQIMNGYVYADGIADWVYITAIDNGDGTTTTLYFDTGTGLWIIL